VAAAIALNLAVFSHILNHTLTRLQTAFYRVVNPPPVTTDLSNQDSSALILEGIVKNIQGIWVCSPEMGQLGFTYHVVNFC